uniref:Uncharacterized protein n=1 Tax=Anguilla anguilla TaxID=7936 RepID=A0A0E9PEL6_ANGAN
MDLEIAANSERVKTGSLLLVYCLRETADVTKETQ